MENETENTNIIKASKKDDKSLKGVKLEKGDTTAIIIAALTTVLPFALVIIFIYFILTKMIFRF